MALAEYERKRSFSLTPEPKGERAPKEGPLHFVVQKHDASHLHYDLRLELEGVLKSWAVPKGPSLNPEDKRLAMETEDHPYAYKDFEGVIPEGSYGAGDVIVWDEGLYASPESAERHVAEKRLLYGYHKGDLSFVVYGHKIKGAFRLVKIKNTTKKGKDNAWLLIKSNDEFASTEDVTKDMRSIKTGKTLPRDASVQTDKTVPLGKRAPPLPKAIRPMLATLVDEPFDRPNWYFETKWDGYRAIAQINNRTVTLYSRAGNDFTSAYPSIAEALRLFSHDCILDGEIIALKDGRPDFHALQDYERTGSPLQYAVFDLLYLDGSDMRSLPLSERKDLLRRVLPHDERLLFSQHITRHGIAFFSLMRERGLEGMIAKNSESPYREGVRGTDWLKVKHLNRQEAIIVGFTEPRGARKHLGALVLGAYARGSLVYIGHSGGGFTDKELQELYDKLAKIKRSRPPIQGKIPVNAPVTWVSPHYVCELSFMDWTPSGFMRHPVYLGMRTDKKPSDVRREIPVLRNEHSEEAAPPPIDLSNLDKIFWPEEGYTKGDLISYYDRMADTMLEYLKDRPENLNRHPNGWRGKSFYQKDMSGSVPSFGRSVSIWSESNQKTIRYLVCDNKETLLHMANLGCIEINPWSSRVGNLEHPDFMIFDIDPHGHSFDDVVTVAKQIQKVLQRACAPSYPKTSGKSGLHILVPLGGVYGYDDVRAFSELIMRLVQAALPELTTVERSPAKRGGRIYLDYLQNREGQTIAAPYSVRPYPGATVSTPLSWQEVKKGLDPGKFTINTIEKRLSQKGDLMQGVLGKGVNLSESIRCLQKESGRVHRHKGG